jgi:hypothetical protein
MCFKTKTKSQSSTTQGPEQWVRDAGQGIYGQAATIAQQPMAKYTGERVADYGSDFEKARTLVSGMAGNDNPDYGAARSAFSSVAGADDPNKSVQDYMNPFLEAVLTPTLRKIQEQGILNRQRLNAQATQAGAFGDSRHGVLDAQLARDEAQNIGDTTGKLYAQGWDTATQARNAALQRILSAGSAQQGLGTANDNRTSTITQLLTALADKQRDVSQAKDTAAYEDFNKEQKYPYEQLTWLMQLLNQTPSLTTGTGVNIQEGTDNSGLQLLGKIAGTALTGGLKIPGL